MSAQISGPVCVFDCPRGKGVTASGKCSAAILGPGAPWKNVGTNEKPTLEPSYNCVGGCGWHGYIVDGEAVETPSVKGATATITTLNICSNCGHPELLSVGLSPQPNGMRVEFERTKVRP